MLTLNLEQAQELIDSVIAKYGAEKVYEMPSRDGCRNVHSDEQGNLSGGCIVGTAFIEYGVTPQQIIEVGGEFMSAWSLSDALELREVLMVDNAAQDYLVKIQSRQDTGVAWGEANAIALSEIRGDNR